MTPIALHFDSFDRADRVIEWRVPRDAERAVDIMGAHNVAAFRAGVVRPLYASGIFYVPEVDGGPEELWSAPLVAEMGYADCEDLAAYRIGELRAAGERARAVVRRVAPDEWHVFVETAHGLEDPSREVMGW